MAYSLFDQIKQFQLLSLPLVSTFKLVKSALGFHGSVEKIRPLFLSLVNIQERNTVEISGRTNGFPTVLDIYDVFLTDRYLNSHSFSRMCLDAHILAKTGLFFMLQKLKRFKHPLLFSSGRQVTLSTGGPCPGL